MVGFIGGTWWYRTPPDATTLGLLGWRRQGDGSSAGRVSQTCMDAAALQPAHAAVAVHAEPGAAGRELLTSQVGNTTATVAPRPPNVYD